MKQTVWSVAFAAALSLAAASTVAAQPGAGQGPSSGLHGPAANGGQPQVRDVAPAGIESGDDAQQTRENLRNILRRHSPSLADVLRLDPSLLSSDAYLAPYPDLARFLAAHPEVIRNSGYFVGPSRNEWNQQSEPHQATARAVEMMFAYLMVFSGLATFMGLIAWALKTLVDHRRWLRQSTVQTEAHTKVLDRLSSNEDLMAYIQTPAGRRFLESAPIPMEGARSFGAPIGRILFSAQAGTVVTFLGMGLLYVSARLAANPNINDAAPFLFVVGIVATAIGVGLFVSSGIAYMLSKHLGLLEGPSSSHA
jgi:hypothetical protein